MDKSSNPAPDASGALSHAFTSGQEQSDTSSNANYNGEEDTEHIFDAIVVGSGYGGAVSAYRLAEAGLKVAILEIGYEHKAPNIPRGQASEWDPENGLFGPHRITRLNKAVSAWTGTGYGGGSLVNAAVMIRKDNFENYPGGISRETLAPYYDRAERMLGAKVYPVHFAPSPYARTIKTRVMLEGADKLGVPSVMPPVAITYLEPGEAIGTVKKNQYGADQQGCRQCGECSLPGCNYQAKNSLDLTYLYGAQHQYGARIFTGNRVDKISPMMDGTYEVRTVDSKTGKLRLFKTKVLVLAAGSLGSSEILLRNKHVYFSLPELSAKLGSQYTSNGTFIGFAVRSKTDLDPSGGPEITAGLDFNGPDGKNQGHLMFDGSFRSFTYETFYITGRLLGFQNRAIKVLSAAFKLAEKVKLVVPRTTLPLLVIGRDNAVGRFMLDEKGRLRSDLNPQDNHSFYTRANEHLRAFTRAMGTRFLKFPHWWLERKIDVPHNLGGVPMGNNASDGVVDHLGRVFGYKNMLVLDGSIIPATMGANPALTIAALAERSMEHVIAELKEQGEIRAVENAPLVTPDTRDLTAQFFTMHKQVSSQSLRGEVGNDLPEALKGKTVLWTPGILARHMGNHSKHILARLREMGLKVIAVPVNTDVKTAENIELIKEHIRSLAPGEGILAGHSRGGVMNLDAYRQLSDEDKARISRIILIQSPVNGTPLADFVLKSATRRRTVAYGSRLVFGNNVIDTVRELSARGREVAERALPPLTEADLAKVFTLRSKIARGESPSFELLRAINTSAGEKSDGVTPWEMSEIKGAGDVTLTNYDHEQCVIQEPTLLKRLTGYRPHKVLNAGDVIESLVRLACKGGDA